MGVEELHNLLNKSVQTQLLQLFGGTLSKSSQNERSVIYKTCVTIQALVVKLTPV